MSLPSRRRASRFACAALALQQCIPCGIAQQAAASTETTQSSAAREAVTQPAVESATRKPEPPKVSPQQRSRAESSYLRGAKHLDRGEFEAAESDFAHAVGFNPSRPEYLAALALTREHRVTALIQQAAVQRPVHPAEANALLGQARALDATNPRVTQHAEQLQHSAPPTQRTQFAGTTALETNGTRHSYHERTDTRSLANRLATDYGFRIAFDPEMTTRPLRIDVDDVGFDNALRIFSLLSNTFITPLDPHTAVLANDTADNRERYDRVVQETFYLPGLTPDQLKDFVSIAQNVLDVRQVSVTPNQGALVVRGPADRVAAVESIFADLQQGTGDVVIDLKLYSIDKQNTRNLGVVLPQSVSAFSLASEAQSIVSQNSSLIAQLVSSGVIPSTASVYQIAAYLVFAAGLGSSSMLTNSFLLFGDGLTTGVLSLGSSAAINLVLTSSEARALDDLQLRIADRQTATFKSGTRYPIQTSLFSDIASSTSSSLGATTVNGVSLSSLLSSYLGTSAIGSSATIPQIQYEDLGLVVSAVPRIQRNSTIGMHLEVKVTALAGSSLNGIPVLGSRQFSSDLTVADGETAMMISNTTQSETAAISGVPGLSELPGFQTPTNRNSTKITGNLVLMITPHIVRHAHSGAKGPYVPLTMRPGED